MKNKRTFWRALGAVAIAATGLTMTACPDFSAAAQGPGSGTAIDPAILGSWFWHGQHDTWERRFAANGRFYIIITRGEAIYDGFAPSQIIGANIAGGTLSAHNGQITMVATHVNVVFGDGRNQVLPIGSALRSTLLAGGWSDADQTIRTFSEPWTGTYTINYSVLSLTLTWTSPTGPAKGTSIFIRG